MAFNTTNLQEYVNLRSKEIAIKAVMTPTTAKLLATSGNSASGLKPGLHAILKMSQDVNFQSGAGCGRNPGSAVTLSDKNMEVVAIADFLNICPKTLYSTFYSLMLSQGQDPEGELDSQFANYIIDNRNALIAAAIEKLIWQGDKTITGASNLKQIDGLLKQIVAGGTGTYIALADASADIIVKLQNDWLAMPEEVKNQEDFRVFISETDYNKYLVATANKNYFNPADPYKIFGTTATMVPTPGLNGTGKIVMARLSDLAYGVDGVNDSDSASFRYSMETEQQYLDYRFALGVGVVNSEQIGIAA